MSCSSSVFGTVRLILSFFIICTINRLYCFFLFSDVQNHLLKKISEYLQIILILKIILSAALVVAFSLTSFATEKKYEKQL
jgi:hypothetical protein